jgi:RNA polymerase sigma-70 factor (ECF subfamily)
MKMTLDWDERQLILRAQRGDTSAFARLIKKHKTRAIRLIGNLVKDTHLTEDVFQEVLIRTYRGLSSFRGDSAFYTWFYQVVLNTSKSYLIIQSRQEKLHNELCCFPAQESVDDVNTPECFLHGKQSLYMLDGLIQTFPQAIRGTILLREVNGLTYDEIANMMRCPVGTVRSRLFRGRQMIANYLQQPK